MSISRFNLETPASNMQSFYNFLNTNKAGTFLDNATIGLSEEGTKLTISTANATFEISVGSIEGTSNLAAFTANVTSSLIVRPGSSSHSSIKIKGAILCSKGIIFDISSEFGHSPEIVLTVDNAGDLAVIFKKSSSFHDSWGALISISGYRVTATDSSSEATVTLTPQYGAQKTSLAPIVPMCNDNSISLPYVFAALHTQAASQGIQAMRMNGSNYITNGVWYIKDGE